MGGEQRSFDRAESISNGHMYRKSERWGFRQVANVEKVSCELTKIEGTRRWRAEPSNVKGIRVRRSAGRSYSPASTRIHLLYSSQLSSPHRQTALHGWRGGTGPRDHGVRTCRSSGECEPTLFCSDYPPILGHPRRLRHFHVIPIGFPSPSSCHRRVTIALSPPIEIRRRVT